MIIGDSAAMAIRACSDIASGKSPVSEWSCLTWFVPTRRPMSDVSLQERMMRGRVAVLATMTAIGMAAFANLAAADNDDLKCTDAAQAGWMSQDATKDFLKQQGYQEVRKIEVTE